MRRFLHGVHDADGAELMADKPGWIVSTVAVGCDPKDTSGVNFYAWTSRGYGVIVRLNNGYYSHNSYPGTIPTPDKYDEFAVRCANFVAASDGCDIVIIGNETNMTAETPNRGGILPADYARCYRMCRDAIHRVKPHCQVLVAGCAPWNQQSGDWLGYWRTVLVNVGDECDGVAIHTYSHGTDPALITSEEMVHGWHWHFRVYQDQLKAMPAILYGLPVYISETDQDDPWADTNSGWVQAAYAEIDRWNQSDVPAIHALCLFRSLPGDHWSFADKNGVKADFRAAVALGYQAPITPISPEPPTPEPPRPPQPTPAPDPDPARDIDPRLLARGVHFDFAKVPAGTGYWRIVKAEWLENAAATHGPDHHILGQILRDGAELGGILLEVEWPSGTTNVVSKADDPHASFNYDYAMGPSLNEYSIYVYDRAPSDKATGIGMGKQGNPREHTSTWISWEYTISEGVTAPIPPTPIPGRGLVWPVVGPITQYFGQHEIGYPGSPGHDGIDYGVPTGTHVLAVADGIVKWVDNDPSGFGLYVRIFHPAHGFHSFMGHLSTQLVAAGEHVTQGQTIGLSGSTGNSTGPHLHYSCRIGEADTYFDLHDGYQNGCANPLAVHGLINRSDPNMREEA